MSFYTPPFVVHSSSRALVCLVWSHNISPCPRMTELLHLFGAWTFGSMLGFNHHFTIQYIAPACDPKVFSIQTASLFYCCMAFSPTLHRAKALCVTFSAWNYYFCKPLLNYTIKATTSICLCVRVALTSQKMLSRVYYSSMTDSNLRAHSSWQRVIWLAHKPHCWELKRWGLKLYWWLAGWGAVSRQRC